MPQWATGSKFLLTVGCLLAVFALFILGRDVSKLEIIVPSILGFYGMNNVIQDAARRKYGSYDDDGNMGKRVDSSLSGED